MSTKRPGVQAALNLLKATENNDGKDQSLLWDHTEQRLDELIKAIPFLEERQNQMDLLQVRLEESTRPSLAVEDLVTVLNWKHTVGKNRPFNVKLVRSNSSSSVKAHSEKALQMAVALEDVCNDEKCLEAPMKELMVLKGVGPATASAILSLVRPDAFCYFYDEAIDCFESSRKYTLPVYSRVNQKCLQLASKLREWSSDSAAAAATSRATTTTQQVARILWISARYMALNNMDLTRQAATHVDGTEDLKAAAATNKKSSQNVLSERAERAMKRKPASCKKSVPKRQRRTT